MVVSGRFQLLNLGLFSAFAALANPVPPQDGSPLTQAAVQQAIRQTFDTAKPPGSTVSLQFSIVQISPPSNTSVPGPNGTTVPMTMQKVHVKYTALQERRLPPSATGEPASLDVCTWNPEADLVFFRPQGGAWEFTINGGDPFRRQCTVTPVAGVGGGVASAVNAVARVGAPPAGPRQPIAPTPPPPPSTTIRIDQPTVTQKQSDYPNVVFRAGDRVTVDAGGCVQTGGPGLATYRYVNPAGPDSDRLHLGTIRIPGATDAMRGAVNGFVPISSILHRPLVVPDGASGPLGLGYLDGDGQYADNGYQILDSGIQDQCKTTGPAWVLLTLSR